MSYDLMYNTLYHFPEQFLSSWDLVSKIKLKAPPKIGLKSIYLAGMGGSALPGHLVNDYLFGRYTLTVISDYSLPDRIGPGDLVLVASYSGNTEETLEVFDEALKRGCQIVVLTHGGRLKKEAHDKGITIIPVPDCIQPRCASGHFFASIVCFLERIGRIPPQKRTLENLTKFLKSRRKAEEEIGRKLAEDLKGKVPVIYGPSELKGACIIFKIKINENAKVQSFFNVFPELNHNEMVGYTQLLMNPAIVYLRRRQMHPRIGRRMEVMKELLGDKIPFHSVELKGANLLEEMFDAVLIGDYTSYYLAKSYGIDPVPVQMVEDFKKRLG